MSRTPGRKTVSRPPSGTRRRKNIMVNPALLQRAVEITGAKDQSEAIELALRRLEEDAFILEGLASLRGAFPDHPDHDP